MKITKTPACIGFEIEHSAAWIHIRRPESMNALNRAAYVGIRLALKDAVGRDDVRSIVLIGEGGNAFCAGGDLKEMKDDDENNSGQESIEAGLGLFRALRECPKPTIAAVDGYAVGSGFEIAILCDMIHATEQSSFALPEIRRSLLPDPGLLELSQMIPPGELMRILLTAKSMAARRAFDLGLVQELYSDRSALIAGVKQVCDDIAYGAPMAAAAYKQIVRKSQAMSLESAVHLRETWWNRIQASEDRLEGPRAFAEKRAPEWKGR